MDPFSSALLASNVGLGIYGATRPSRGPDYGAIGNIYTQRLRDIGDFSSQLSAARAKYLTSLGNMYNQAYSRFASNVEPSFASRGLSVRGGAFASALAKKSAEYESELTPLAFKAEREDIGRVADARERASMANLNAIAGGPALQYAAEREDSAALGSLLERLTSYSLMTGGFKRDPFASAGSGPGNYGGYDSPFQVGYGRVGRGKLELNYGN